MAISSGKSSARKGRPCKVLPAAMQQHMLDSMAAPRGCSNKQRVGWSAGCGDDWHRYYISVDAVYAQYMAYIKAHGVGNHMNFRLPCTFCGVGNTNKSKMQCDVIRMVMQIWPKTALYFDVCMQGSDSKSSADVLLGEPSMPHGCLAIMADGEGHFKAMHGTSAAHQQLIDRRYDLAAYGSGYSVVRLHFKDSYAQWRAVLQNAKQLAAHCMQFILYSPFFDLPDCVGMDICDVQSRYKTYLDNASNCMKHDMGEGRTKRPRAGYV